MFCKKGSLNEVSDGEAWTTKRNVESQKAHLGASNIFMNQCTFRRNSQLRSLELELTLELGYSAVIPDHFETVLSSFDGSVEDLTDSFNIQAHLHWMNDPFDLQTQVAFSISPVK